MDTKTATMVREWLKQNGGDCEALARWMAAVVRIGSRQDCRALIAQALESRS